MSRQQRRVVIIRFVVASSLFNLGWFLVALPRYEAEAAALAIGAVALYGQGSLFALALWAARRSVHTPLVGPSRRTLVGVALGQPMIAIATGLLAAFASPRLDRGLASVAFFFASVFGGALVVVCLHRDTRASAERVAFAMLAFTASWVALPIAISSGWDVGVLHVGALGGGRSDRILHPLVTALWQIPMAALVAWWCSPIDGGPRVFYSRRKSWD